MDDIGERYERLVAAFSAEDRSATELVRLAADAEGLASAAGSTWFGVQARALAAAARAVAGAEQDLEAIIDAPLGPVDDVAVTRLEGLLPGDGSLAERLAAHHDASRVTTEALPAAAERLLELMRDRAVEDLELPEAHGIELVVVSRAGEAWRARLEPASRPARLVLNATAPWTADRLTRAISSLGYPGRHLVRLMRSASPEWSPSPQATLDSGLDAVGREVLLADHELAHELERIGRAAGVSWHGDRIVSVRRALDDLAPAYAAAALIVQPHEAGRRLAQLGADLPMVERLVARWRDPLARARSLARAAGPPLVRAWLVRTGQTIGLQRLLTERLVPSMLRAEMLDAPD